MYRKYRNTLTENPNVIQEKALNINWVQSSELRNTNSTSIYPNAYRIKKIAFKIVKIKPVNWISLQVAGSYSELYEDKRTTAAPLAQMKFLSKFKNWIQVSYHTKETVTFPYLKWNKGAQLLLRLKQN